MSFKKNPLFDQQTINTREKGYPEDDVFSTHSLLREEKKKNRQINHDEVELLKYFRSKKDLGIR